MAGGLLDAFMRDESRLWSMRGNRVPCWVGVAGKRTALILIAVGICGYLWEGRGQEDRKERLSLFFMQELSVVDSLL